MYKSYEEAFHHKADFRVKYEFYDVSQRGNKSTPFQGYRSDFWYYHEDQPNPNSVYMIYPEFEDENLNVITDTTQSVPVSGTARMWIAFSKMRSYHKDKIKVGLQGFFLEGGKRVAECTVIEIISLDTNPTEPIEIRGRLYS
jgi:hypothetical protein